MESSIFLFFSLAFGSSLFGEAEREDEATVEGGGEEGSRIARFARFRSRRSARPKQKSGIGE